MMVVLSDEVHEDLNKVESAPPFHADDFPKAVMLSDEVHEDQNKVAASTKRKAKNQNVWKNRRGRPLTESALECEITESDRDSMFKLDNDVKREFGCVDG